MPKFIGKRTVVAIAIIASTIIGVMMAYSDNMLAIVSKDQSGYGNINAPSDQSLSGASKVKVIVSNNNSLFGNQNDTKEWLTYHHDFFRTGYDPNKSNISTPSSGLHSVYRKWTSISLDGAIYAEPLVAQNMVFVATENNTIYSLDSTTGRVIWQTNLGSPVSRADLPCGDIDPTGITGTPVIDITTRTIFAVAFLRGNHLHELFALDIDTGKIRFETPIDPPGSDPLVQQQRGALALLYYNAVTNGTTNDTVARGRGGIIVYVPFGGLFGDCGSYHGWMVGDPIPYTSLESNFTNDKTSNNNTGVSISASKKSADQDRQQQQLPLLSFQIPTTREGGIWAPSGPAIDLSGNVFVTTGNSESSSQFDFGNSLIKLSPELAKIVDWFSPNNWAELNTRDTDLGSVGPAILSNDLSHSSKNISPSISEIFQIGKEGIGYILRTDKLGGINGQLYSAPVCARGAYGGTAYAAPYLYIPCRDGLVSLYLPSNVGSNTTAAESTYSGTTIAATNENKSNESSNYYKESNSSSSTYPSFTVKWKGPSFWAGPPIVADDAVWTIDLDNGTLYAFDLQSGQILFRENLGYVNHFSTPSSAHGQIFAYTYNRIVCFSTKQ